MGDDTTPDLETVRRARLNDALLRVGRGDRSAFEFVYRQTSAKLFGICLRIFPNRTDAEEALQDAYLTIWNKAASFESGRASPISWLATLTRNRAIDRLRASGKAKYVAVEEASEIADPAPIAESQMLERDQNVALHSCIETLDPRDAGFIRSAYVGGATYADLAQDEGLPLGTVKSRIRRALIRLRACLEGQQ